VTAWSQNPVHFQYHILHITSAKVTAIVRESHNVSAFRKTYLGHVWINNLCKWL
jgi:hypothetical protein